VKATRSIVASGAVAWLIPTNSTVILHPPWQVAAQGRGYDPVVRADDSADTFPRTAAKVKRAAQSRRSPGTRQRRARVLPLG
jgi:hypothetical protein